MVILAGIVAAATLTLAREVLSLVVVVVVSSLQCVCLCAWYWTELVNCCGQTIHL